MALKYAKKIRKFCTKVELEIHSSFLSGSDKIVLLPKYMFPGLALLNKLLSLWPLLQCPFC